MIRSDENPESLINQGLKESLDSSRPETNGAQCGDKSIARLVTPSVEFVGHLSEIGVFIRENGMLDLRLF